VSTDKLIQKLKEAAERFQEVETQLSDAAVSTNPQELERLGRLHSELQPLVQAFQRDQQIRSQLAEAKELLQSGDDEELTALAHEEIAQLEPEQEALIQQVQKLLLPKDPNDEKNVIIEIRPGTGGEEAALFAGDLFRIYARYAERRGWKYEVLDSEPSDMGGYKSVTMSVQGRGAYSQLKHESGVHRVQRVPTTESGGRIHTSAATVAVLPEAEEVDVHINSDDLEIDTYKASSAGGQHVQKNETAVRIIHKPTGIIVTCQDERSQLQNRERAMRMLRTKLYEHQLKQQTSERDQMRRSQIGSGDRSEKIRTYNFPDRRVTDHRVNVTLYNLEGIFDGDIQPFLDALIEDEQAKRLDEIQ
jgi:peptide chain release factor 1